MLQAGLVMKEMRGKTEYRTQKKVRVHALSMRKKTFMAPDSEITELSGSLLSPAGSV